MNEKKLINIYVPGNCEWKNCVRIFCISGIMASIVFLPFIILDNGIFLFYGDYNVQQIPFYQLAHYAVKSGNVNWSFNTDLGSNFLASYSFYLLGSPFFWLTIPFPSDFVPYLMGPLFIIKFALAAVSGYVFIRRFTNTAYMATIGGILYAFSGYMVYNIFYNHFLEVVIFFPLLLIGLEEFMVNNKRGLFAISITLNLLINYYFFVADVVFLFIYFFVRIYYKGYNISFKKVMFLVFEILTGCLMGCLLLIPSAIMVLNNPRVSNLLFGYDMLLYSKVQKYGLIIQSLFFPPDMPALPNFFPNADAKWYSVAAYTPLFGMSGVISFLRYKRKNFIKSIIIILLIMVFIPFLNSAFNGFNSSFYTRWFYILTLFLSLATVISLETNNIDYKFGIKTNLIIIILFALIGILPKKVDNTIIWWKLPNYPIMFWVNVCFAIFGLFLAFIIIKQYKNNRYSLYKLSLICVCIFSIIYSNAQISWAKFNSSSNSYNKIVEKGLNANFELNNNEFFRVDVYNKNYTDNWAMFWKLPTIQCFHSTITPSIFNFYKELGIKRDVATRIPSNNYDGLRQLLSVKYIFVENDLDNSNDNPHLPPGYDFYDNQNGFDIYLNSHFVPIGFAYDKYVNESIFKATPEKQRDSLLLKGLLLNDTQLAEYRGIINDVSYSNSKMLSDEDLIKDTENLKRQSSSKFLTSSTGFSSEINLDKDKLVLFTVPFDEGWSATVNGNQTKIENVDNGLMAIKCNQGTNTINFYYKVPGLKLSFYLTISGFLIFFLYIFLIKKLRKVQK